MQIIKRLWGARIFVFLWAITIAPPSQVGNSTSVPRRIELTETDLFSGEPWTSTQVEVKRLHLGMQWPAVSTTAKEQGLRLKELGVPGLDKACSGKGWCEVLDARSVIIGVSVFFGERHEITKLSIDRPYSVGIDERVASAEVIRQFKGRTLLLFTQYSKMLRLQLFGEPSRIAAGAGFTTFDYPRRGVALTLQGCAGKPLEDPCSEIQIDFVNP
jgi:hypothetical protein